MTSTTRYPKTQKIISLNMNKELYYKRMCDGTWSHKYNTALNERIADDIGESNDRTAYDVGEEPSKTNFDHD